MPFSTDIGKDEIKALLGKWITRQDMRVLDLGCGSGTYGKLMLNMKCRKVAVDAVDYRQRFLLGWYYQEFYLHDIRDTEFLESLGKFDISIAGDVLEHMSTEDAQRVLAKMQEMSDRIIVAVPYEYEQKTNIMWENHIQDDLTPELVEERYPILAPLHIWKENGKPVYGYYFWEKER